MRGKRQDLPTTYEGMEQYLLDAWARVKEGRPDNPQLAELAKKGRLRPTISSLAKEAGVSRTLIGYDGCRYDDVRQAIRHKEVPAEELTVGAHTNMRSINADLRQINRILEERIKVALSEQAAMLNRMSRLEAEYDDKVAEIQRINARGSRNPHEIVGLHVVKPNNKS